VPSPAFLAILTLLLDERKDIARMEANDRRLPGAELHGRQPRRWTIRLGMIADPTLTHVQQLGNLPSIEQRRAETDGDSFATVSDLICTCW
jgi:hypothetical protein